MNRPTAVVSLIATSMCTATTLGDVSNYSNDFSSASGNFWGAASHTTFNGHGDLQLTSDYPGDYFGTWSSGALENTQQIDSFKSSFNFSFNNRVLII